MIRIAVVDDEKRERDCLCNYLELFAKETDEKIKITTFEDGSEIIDKYKNIYDIIFLDIEMKHSNGMKIAEEIRKVDTSVIIMFVTNLAQYASQGYAVNALDYLLKPVGYEELKRKMEKAINRTKKKESRFLTLQVKGGIVKVDIVNIFFVESRGHSLIFHTDTGNYTCYGTMYKVEEQLEPLNFCLISKGILINLEHVDSVRENCVLIKMEKLPISFSRKNIFMKELANYAGGFVS